MVAEEYPQQSTIESKERDKKSVRRRVKAYLFAAAIGIPGGYASGSAIGAAIEHVAAFDVDDDVVDEYRDAFAAVVEQGGTYEGEQSRSVSVNIMPDASNSSYVESYVIDDDPNTSYESSFSAPSYVKALDYVDPLLFEAAEVDTIKLVTEYENGDINTVAGWISTTEPGTIYLNKEHTLQNSPDGVGSTLRHEAAHWIHDSLDTIPLLPLLPRIPDFIDENPSDFQYLSDHKVDSQAYASYDMETEGNRIGMAYYNSANYQEDFAQYVAAMSAPVTETVDYETTVYLDKVRANDDLTLDKSAAVAAIASEVYPGLGNNLFDSVEDHQNRR